MSQGLSEEQIAALSILKADAEMADVLLACVVTAACDGDQKAVATGVESAIRGAGISALRLLATSITREAKFVRMLSEGTGRSIDDIVRGDLESRHAHDPDDLVMFDDVLAMMRTIKPTATPTNQPEENTP